MQPYLIEIWSEKSGDADIIRSVATATGVNYQPGVGYQSITNIKQMLRRVAEHEKPAVILYISDYDDAGQNMPVQVGRHSQFAAWELEDVAGEVAPEVIVDSAALTAELVEELDLPPIPGTTKREIDALEALHPGRLSRILRDRIAELQDSGLHRRVRRAEYEAQMEVQGRLDEITESHEERIGEIQQEAREVVERYQRYYQILGEKVAQRYENLAQRYERHMSELREELNEIEETLGQEIEELDVDLPEIPEPETNLPERDWLFDSRRDFWEQTIRFRKAQGKE